MIFGSVPIKPIQIVEFLKEHLENKASHYMKKGRMDEYPAWTKAVKQTLGELVQKYGGHRACAIFSGSSILQQTKKMQATGAPARTTREFLLDFVWWENEETMLSGRAVMGAECEWASWHKDKEQRANEVLYDFEKLLSFKAPLKLLIFECWDSEARKYLHKKLCGYLEAFSQHVKGECYLFIEFSHGQCFADIYEVKQNGAASNIKLESLDLKTASQRASGGL